MAVKLNHWRSKGGRSGSAGSGSDEYAEVPIGTLDGVNTDFTLTYSPTQYPIIWLELNGVFQQPNVDFTLSGSTITYTVPPVSTDRHFIIYHIGPGASAPGVARNFTGGDNLDYGSKSVYKIENDLGIGAWIKPSAQTSNGVIIFQGSNTVGPTTGSDLYIFYVIWNSSTGSFDLGYSYENGSGTYFQSFAANLPPDEWVFVGLSRDATAETVSVFKGNRVEISLVQTQALANGNALGGTGSGTHLVVGNGYPSAGYAFGGAIEQHYVWGRTVTADELLAAANANPSTTSLVLRLPALGNSPEIDTSGNLGSGVVTGTTLVTGHS